MMLVEGEKLLIMKEKKNYYFGKYYKFVSKDNYAFALIDANTPNGRVMQIITRQKSYVILDPTQVKIEYDSFVTLNIRQKGLSMNGMLVIGSLHPLKKDVMGFLRHLKMNTKHNIYSMYHTVAGKITINRKEVSFNDGYGYIEGDEGSTFPDKYLWFNSSNKDYGVSLSIARIRICNKIHLMGSFLIVKNNRQEFVFSTLNGLKVVELTKYLVILKKGKYRFKLFLDDFEPLPLLSPIEGSLVGEVKESISINVGFELFKGKEKIFSRYNVNGSIERVNL